MVVEVGDVGICIAQDGASVGRDDAQDALRLLDRSRVAFQRSNDNLVARHVGG